MPLHCTATFIALAEPEAGGLVEFYQQLFAQAPSILRPGAYAEFQLPGLRLGIFTPSAAHRAEFLPRSGGAMSLCLEVENLEDAIAHLSTLGYPPPGDMLFASHGREVYAYDPAGNRLIIHQSRA